MKQKNKLILPIIGSLFFVVTIIYIIYYVNIHNLWDVILNQEKLKLYLETTYGDKLYLSFIILQIVQVVIFFIPGEAVQISGGYIFGNYQGILVNFIGIFFGSLLVFLISRFFASPIILYFFSKEKVELFNDVIKSKKGNLIILILFLFPGFPKDSLCYLLGLSNINIFKYLLISNIGRIPAMIVTVFLGNYIAQKKWHIVIIISIITITIFIILFIFKKKSTKLKKLFKKINIS